MIVNEAELRVALGLGASITDAQRARLVLAMQVGHAAVRKAIGYDPEQRSGPAEFYPRQESFIERDDDGGIWDVNSAHTRAVREERSRFNRYLQLERLPLREVEELYVDPSARHGQQAGDFGAGTEYTAGEDYHADWDNDWYCRSGQLIAVGSWPSLAGTVKAVYRAGYSPAEFMGPASSTREESDGATLTTQGVDASPIKSACLIACMAKYMTLKTYSLDATSGLHLPGPLSSEHLGSYSYSLASGSNAALIAGMVASLPPEAAVFLEDFVNYGMLVG